MSNYLQQQQHEFDVFSKYIKLNLSRVQFLQDSVVESLWPAVYVMIENELQDIIMDASPSFHRRAPGETSNSPEDMVMTDRALPHTSFRIRPSALHAMAPELPVVAAQLDQWPVRTRRRFIQQCTCPR